MKLRHFNIMRLLYCLVLALPFVAILSRVIYVQSNKNAYKSYYGETINQSNEVEVNYNELVANNNYLLYLPSQPLVNNGTYRINFNGDITVNNTIYSGYSYFSLFNSNNVLYFAIYGTDKTTIYENLDTRSLNVNFNFNSMVNTPFFTYTFYETIYNDYSFMDNVFEYSVNKFIDDNNFGRVNLFEWTTDLFFDDNQVNNMYVHFVNWYLNYVLLMSTTYILFLVLMWFVNYSRRLLERGMNYDW